MKDFRTVRATSGLPIGEDLTGSNYRRTPSFPEQQRIVGILDEAFDGIATAKANAEKNLQNARALFESHLQSVFTQRGEGWVEKPLGRTLRHQTRLRLRRASTSPIDGDYVMLTPGNFYESAAIDDRGDEVSNTTTEQILASTASTEEMTCSSRSTEQAQDWSAAILDSRVRQVSASINDSESCTRSRASWTDEFFCYIS